MDWIGNNATQAATVSGSTVVRFGDYFTLRNAAGPSTPYGQGVAIPRSVTESPCTKAVSGLGGYIQCQCCGEVGALPKDILYRTPALSINTMTTLQCRFDAS